MNEKSINQIAEMKKSTAAKESTKMEFTTIEKLQLKVSASYGAVIKYYGDKVFVTDIFWKGGFTAEIYEFVETPEETGFGDIQCRLRLTCKADAPFEDNGHAIAWCISRK